VGSGREADERLELLVIGRPIDRDIFCLYVSANGQPRKATKIEHYWVNSNSGTDAAARRRSF
jgi:hypothetical protein